jgi:hypothetical protein
MGVEDLRRLYIAKTVPWRERPISLKYKNAICRQYKYGLTNQEIADQLGVAKATYSQKRNSNEGKALQEELQRFQGDDKAIVETAMRDEAYNSWENLIEARDRMYHAGQYESAAKIDLKILEGLKIWDKAKDLNFNFQGQEIRISLEGGTKEDFVSSPFNTMHLPEAEYELIESESSGTS